MRKAKPRKSRPRPWSEGEVKLLKELYPNNSARDIANELGRTVAAARIKAHKLGICEQCNVWSKRELNLLKRLYPSRTAREIAEQIGRPVQATRMKIVLLGLRKRFRYDERHRVVKGTKEKLCPKCRKWKGESQFYRRRSRKDGLDDQCNKCSYNEERHRTVGEVREKFCRKCKRWKNESDFYKNRATKDGLDSRCKTCSYKPTSKSRKK